MKNILTEELLKSQPESESNIAILDALSDYEINFHIDMEEAKIVENRIKEENMENWKHMLEKTYNEIFEEANKFGCCSIKFEWELIWFIKVMPTHLDWTELFEWWSIYVDKKYRKKWIWKILAKEIMKKYKTLPLYAVTCTKAVMNINKDLWQYEYFKEDLSENVLNIIESEWKLLDSDIIYWNEIFNCLNESFK